MIPHMIFSPQPHRIDDSHLWSSRISPHAPQDVATSGITQPPVIATALLAVAEKLPKEKSMSLLRELYPKLVSYHNWLYTERDPHNEGLLMVFHPWETGLDNAPAWQIELQSIHKPHWITLLKTLKLTGLSLAFRRDTKNLPGDTRIDTATALKFAHAAMALKKRNYDPEKIIADPHFIAYSLSFNSIALAANTALKQIATKLGEKLPSSLEQKFSLAEKNFDNLYDEQTKMYQHYSFHTNERISTPSISNLLPLYSGAVSKQRAAEIVATLTSKPFWTKYPVPSVPTNSPYYDADRFWLGPTWINTNWLLIQGLRRYGYDKEANHIKRSSLELVQHSGMREYFSPEQGTGLGAEDFSWTAALVYDLLSE